MLKIQFYLQKKSDFHRGKSDFLLFEIIRVPAYQGQSDSEYLTSLASQKPHSPE